MDRREVVERRIHYVKFFAFWLFVLLVVIVAVYSIFFFEESGPAPASSCRSGLRDDCPMVDDRLDNLPESPYDEAPYSP